MTIVIRESDAKEYPVEDRVYIGRSSIWGNPYHFYRYGRKRAIEMFAEDVRLRPDMIERARKELRGKVLVCHCKPQACHGDVLARVADGAEP